MSIRLYYRYNLKYAKTVAESGVISAATTMNTVYESDLSLQVQSIPLYSYLKAKERKIFIAGYMYMFLVNSPVIQLL